MKIKLFEMSIFSAASLYKNGRIEILVRFQDRIQQFGEFQQQVFFFLDRVIRFQSYCETRTQTFT
jgi:hypothetical protein